MKSLCEEGTEEVKYAERMANKTGGAKGKFL